MPSTNLPGDSLKGTAGFRYFPGGSTSVAEATHPLNWPAELVPGGGASYRTNKFRSPVQSLDLEHREVWTVGSGREEATLRLRFDEWPESLLDMLGDAADGVTLDYYPRLASTNLFFPVHILDAEGRISEDSDRFAQAEYEADLRLRDASTDRQGFWWLKNDNKLKNPRLSRGTTDGVAEEWDTANVAFGSLAINVGGRCQVITLNTGTSAGQIGIRQDVVGILPGDTVTFSAEAEKGAVTGTAKPRILLDEVSSTGRIQTIATIGSSEITTGFLVFGDVEVSATASSTNVDTIRVRPEIRSDSTGDSGKLRIRDAELTIS